MRLLHPEVREVSDEDLFDLYDVPGPCLRADFVASVDGVVAVGGVSEPLGSTADKAAFRALRAVSDAVIVGAGTARAEDYGPVKLSAAAKAWREAHGRSAQPPLVIVTRTGNLPPRVQEGPLLVAAPEGVSVPAVERLPVEPGALVAALHERGLTRLLCEGGPTLLTSMWTAGVLDELCLTTSALVVGDGPRLLGPVPTTGMRLVSLVHDEPGVLLARWAVVRSPDD